MAGSTFTVQSAESGTGKTYGPDSSVDLHCEKITTGDGKTFYVEAYKSEDGAIHDTLYDSSGKEIKTYSHQGGSTQTDIENLAGFFGGTGDTDAGAAFNDWYAKTYPGGSQPPASPGGPQPSAAGPLPQEGQIIHATAPDGTAVTISAQSVYNVPGDASQGSHLVYNVGWKDANGGDHINTYDARDVKGYNVSQLAVLAQSGGSPNGQPQPTLPPAAGGSGSDGGGSGSAVGGSGSTPPIPSSNEISAYENNHRGQHRVSAGWDYNGFKGQMYSYDGATGIIAVGDGFVVPGDAGYTQTKAAMETWDMIDSPSQWGMTEDMSQLLAGDNVDLYKRPDLWQSDDKKDWPGFIGGDNDQKTRTTDDYAFATADMTAHGLVALHDQNGWHLVSQGQTPNCYDAIVNTFGGPDALQQGPQGREGWTAHNISKK